MSSIFISYSRTDGRFVERLAQDLADGGDYVRFDSTALLPGDRFIDEIPRAIAEADCMVVVISIASAASVWVAFECGLASGHEVAEGVRKLIPIGIDDSPLPGFLSGRHVLSFSLHDPARYANSLGLLKQAAAARKPLVLGTVGSSQHSLPVGALTLFKSAFQEVRLAMTPRGLECHHEDLRSQRSRLEWILPQAKAFEVASRGEIIVHPPDPDRKVGLVDIGARKRWIYSRDRFDGPADLVAKVRRLIMDSQDYSPRRS